MGLCLLSTSGLMATAFHREPPAIGEQTPGPRRRRRRRAGKGEEVTTVGLAL